MVNVLVLFFSDASRCLLCVFFCAGVLFLCAVFVLYFLSLWNPKNFNRDLAYKPPSQESNCCPKERENASSSPLK